MIIFILLIDKNTIYFLFKICANFIKIELHDNKKSLLNFSNILYIDKAYITFINVFFWVDFSKKLIYIGHFIQPIGEL